MIPDLAIKRPVLKYNGGKFKLREWIVSHFPEHITYVETCLGAGSILLAKPRSRFEVANDIDNNIFTFFSVIQDRKKCLELIRLIYWTPYNRNVLANAVHELLTSQPSEVRRAYLFYCVCWMSLRANELRKSNIDFRNRGNLDRSGGHNPPRLFAQVDHLYQIGERFRKVMVESLHADDSIRMYDTPNTLNYIDLPYIGGTRRSKRLYTHELTTVEGHERILQAAISAKGMVIASHYIHPLYENLLVKKNGWQRKTTETLANCMVSGLNIDTKKRIEALYISPNAVIHPELFESN